MFWIAVVVFVIVEGGILLILFRYRQRKGRERMPKQTHGNTRLEVGWTILPALVLAVVMVPTISMIWDLARPPSPDALNITVKGYQWWWGFEYTDSDMTGYRASRGRSRSPTSWWCPPAVRSTWLARSRGRRREERRTAPPTSR